MKYNYGDEDQNDLMDLIDSNNQELSEEKAKKIIDSLKERVKDIQKK